MIYTNYQILQKYLHNKLQVILCYDNRMTNLGKIYVSHLDSVLSDTERSI